MTETVCETTTAQEKSICISTWGDAAEFLGLEPVGVSTNPLFERLTCRVTARGKALLEDYWSLGGIQVYGTNGEHTAWGEESLGYTSLDRKELIQLAIFCAARDGKYKGFVLHNGSYLVILSSQDRLNSYVANAQALAHNASVYEFVPNTRTFTQRH